MSKSLCTTMQVLSTMTKQNFESMSWAELKAYITSHREDDEAFRVYIDLLHTDPDVKRISGHCDDEGIKILEGLIKERV